MHAKKAERGIYSSQNSLITEKNPKKGPRQTKVALTKKKLSTSSASLLFPEQRSLFIFPIWLFIISISILLSASRLNAQESTTPANIILDNETAGEVAAGEFEPFKGYRNYRANALRSIAPGVNAFRFRPDFPLSGYYQAYAWWPDGTNNSNKISVVIHHRDGMDTVEVDQAIFGGQWVPLGIYKFEPAHAAYVEFSNPFGGEVFVDAVRFQYLGTDLPALGIETTALPVGVVGESYSASLSAVGGTPPYSWSTKNNLPEGLLFLNEGILDNWGSIVGTPKTPGRFIIRIELRDVNGNFVTRELDLQVVKAQAATGNGIGNARKRKKSNLTTIHSVSADQEAKSAMQTVETTADAALQSDPDLSGLIGILNSLPEGDWAKVNTNLFSDVWAPAELRPLRGCCGNPTPSKIITAWSSFAWDRNRGDLLIYGGGHANYPGNDVYRWRGTTRQWERASLPSGVIQDDLGNNIAIDGVFAAPTSAHTYDNSIFLPIVDRFLTFGGATWGEGNSYKLQVDQTTERRTGPYFFDPAKADGNKVGGTTGSHVQREGSFPEVLGGEMWENRDIYANIPGNPSLPKNFINGATGYTEQNGRDVVFINGRPGGTATSLYKYTIHDIDDPTLDTWEKVGRFFNGLSGQGAGAYDPVLNIFVRTAKPAKIGYWDLNTASPSNRDVIFVPNDPTGEFELTQAFGMDYDPVRNQFALWDGDGEVWMLEPPPVVSTVGWELEKQPTPSSEIPNGDAGTGILGKWKYIPNLDAFLGLQDINQGNIWLYKPLGWQNPEGPSNGNVPPTVGLTSPADGATFALGDTIDITADASDTDGSIAKVEFFQDTTKLGEATTAPYSFTWSNAPVGDHSLTAVATDDGGATTTSVAVAVSVSGNGGNVPPTVGLTSPADDATFALGDTIDITADASDTDGSVAKVEFFQDTTKLGEATSAPYSFTWTNAPLGNHSLTAVASDDGGATTISAAVIISVLGGGSEVTIVLRDGLDGYGGTQDTYLSTWHASTSFGSSPRLLDNRFRYSNLIRFAIFQSEGGPIPDGATIQSATLSLYKFSSYNHSFRAHRMFADWSENEATWNERLTGAPWSTAGASGDGIDYNIVADGEGSVTQDPQFLDIDVTASLQAFIGGAENYGWRLIGNGRSNNKKYHSSEFTDDPTLRPALTIVIDDGS